VNAQKKKITELFSEKGLLGLRAKHTKFQRKNEEGSGSTIESAWMKIKSAN